MRRQLIFSTCRCERERAHPINAVGNFFDVGGNETEHFGGGRGVISDFKIAEFWRSFPRLQQGMNRNFACVRQTIISRACVGVNLNPRIDIVKFELPIDNKKF